MCWRFNGSWHKGNLCLVSSLAWCFTAFFGWKGGKRITTVVKVARKQKNISFSENFNFMKHFLTAKFHKDSEGERLRRGIWYLFCTLKLILHEFLDFKQFPGIVFWFSKLEIWWITLKNSYFQKIWQWTYRKSIFLKPSFFSIFKC